MSLVYEIEHSTEINAFLWELLFNFEIQMEQSKRGKRATYELEIQRKSSNFFKSEMVKLFDLSFHFAISHYSMILIFSYIRTTI